MVPCRVALADPTNLRWPASNAAREFFTLARVGAQVYIAQTQPKDATWGEGAPRLQDYNDSDPPLASSFLRRPSKSIRPNI